MVAIDAREVSKQFFLRHNPSLELKVWFLGLFHADKRQSVEPFIEPVVFDFPERLEAANNGAR